MQLVSRAGDMTTARMLDELRTFGPGGEMPHHSRWAWQATGRMLLDPSAAEALGRLVIEEKSIGFKGRALAFDLLASVGHAEAQSAMRDALRNIERDDRFPSLLNRAGFITEPEPRTVQLVADIYESADGIARQSAATTLGASAGHLYRTGQTDDALRHVRRLETDLRTQSDATDRRALILGLGNAGVDEAVATIAAHARDDAPAVRRAVATALRKTPGLVAEEALDALMADADPRVGRAAVRALGRHPLNADHLGTLAQRVMDGSLGDSTHGPLVDLLVRNADLDTQARRTLALALAHRTSDPRVRARLARL